MDSKTSKVQILDLKNFLEKKLKMQILTQSQQKMLPFTVRVMVLFIAIWYSVHMAINVVAGQWVYHV